MKNKILFLGRFPPPIHGASKMNEFYFNSLKKSFNVHRIKINYSKTVEEIGIFNLKKILGIFVVFFKILFKLIFFNPNLVYFEIAPTGSAFLRDSTYVLLSKLFHKKIIFAIHARGIDSATKHKLKKKYYQLVFKKTKIIIISNSLYNDIKNIFSKKDVYILNNSIEDNFSNEELSHLLKNKKTNSQKNFLFIAAGMAESKGPMDTLEFCEKLKENRTKFQCSFMGAFADKSFKKKWFKSIKEKNLSKEVNYLGAVYGEEKNNFLKNTDTLIFPTKYNMECFPLVILEAYMYGIPVLSYDTGAIKEMIPENYLGVFSKKKTPEELYNLYSKNKNKFDRKKIRKYFEKNFIIQLGEKKLNKIILKELE